MIKSSAISLFRTTRNKTYAAGIRVKKNSDSTPKTQAILRQPSESLPAETAFLLKIDIRTA